MPPRLGHRKSRNGCLKCKQRRVKCDELVPCTACARHDLECSLVTSSRPGEARSGQSPNSSTHTGNSPSALENDPFSIFDGSAKAQGQDPDWRADMELMHHLTAVTWDTFPKGPGRQEVWQRALPRLALAPGNEFVLHQVLAVAAYHMASLYPDDHVRHSVRASQHQHSAIQGLRRAVAQINQDSCHGIFATASILTISAFATHSACMAHDLGQPTLDSLIEVFSLVRGVHRILQNWEDVIMDGPLGRVLHLDLGNSGTPLLSAILQELEESIANNGLNGKGVTLSIDGARSLVECIKFACSKERDAELRIVNMWALYLGNNFLGSLCKLEPSALETVKYYVRVLEAVESDNWYLEGWSSGISQDIEKICIQRIPGL